MKTAIDKFAVPTEAKNCQNCQNYCQHLNCLDEGVAPFTAAYFQVPNMVFFGLNIM